jgi:hypothetical protein
MTLTLTMTIHGMWRGEDLLEIRDVIVRQVWRSVCRILIDGFSVREVAV